MKVLMIEDNEETIHGLIDAVDERGWEHEVATFKDAQDKIITFDPDVIVMDWMFDDEDAELGKPILEDVLSKEFRPVIVFSAHDLSTVLEDTINEFPLINFTRKGGDDSELACTIDGWKESAVALSNLRHNMNTALVESAKALKNFAIWMRSLKSRSFLTCFQSELYSFLNKLKLENIHQLGSSIHILQ